MDGQRVSEVLPEVYRRLMDRYGPQRWWPAQSPFEVIVGAILTQSAAWTNVARAITSLREAGRLSPAGLRSLPGDELARLIYSCGYYNVKARKLKAFVGWLGEEYRDDLDGMLAVDTGVLRRQLLGIYGIGEETADSILLYAAGKPSFVIDAYTRRIVGRLGLDTGKCTYAACQALFTDNLPADASLYNEYHALLVQLGKDVCRTRPRCGPCCLNPGSLNDPASPSAAFPCAALVRR